MAYKGEFLQFITIRIKFFLIYKLCVQNLNIKLKFFIL